MDDVIICSCMFWVWYSRCKQLPVEMGLRTGSIMLGMFDVSFDDGNSKVRMFSWCVPKWKMDTLVNEKKVTELRNKYTLI